MVHSRENWLALNRRIGHCTRCPRLRQYCQEVAAEKRRAFLEWNYWGRPVPNFGDSQARLLVVGLAPAAHGANRTGRLFTGDRSGDWLYRALHKAKFANQPTATSRADGLELLDCAITDVCHCAPPDNKPLPEEVQHCSAWLTATFNLVPARVFLALGQLAWKAMLDDFRRREWVAGAPPKFSHGAQLALTNDRWLLASYHPSQRNTQTGLLTEAMLDGVFATARRLLDQPKRREEASGK